MVARLYARIERWYLRILAAGVRALLRGEW